MVKKFKENSHSIFEEILGDVLQKFLKKIPSDIYVEMLGEISGKKSGDNCAEFSEGISEKTFVEIPEKKFKELKKEFPVL